MANVLPIPIEVISIIGLTLTAVALVLLARAHTRFFPSPFKRLIGAMLGILVLSMLTYSSRAFAVNTDTYAAYAFAAEFNVVLTLMMSVFFIAAAFLVLRLSEMYGFGGKPAINTSQRNKRKR